MLANSDGDFHGMLSGGCLEGDLAERSEKVIQCGVAAAVTYDLRGDDEVFGLGVGCEGALSIFIQPLNAVNDYEPFKRLVSDLENSEYAELRLTDNELELGIARVRAPLRVLILGAGQDADPLIQFGVALGWELVISDHRPAAIDRLCAADLAVVAYCVPASEIATQHKLDRFDAAIVMSHNLGADRSYLNTLADTSIEFVGLLGPPHRRDRLLGEIGANANKLGDRLRSPVGKEIGGRGPAAIALEIAAELQAYSCAESQP